MDVSYYDHNVAYMSFLTGHWMQRGTDLQWREIVFFQNVSKKVGHQTYFFHNLRVALNKNTIIFLELCAYVLGTYIFVSYFICFLFVLN